MGTGKLNAGGNCMEMLRSILQHKVRYALENSQLQWKMNLFKRISTSIVFLVKIIEEETSVHIILQVG